MPTPYAPVKVALELAEEYRRLLQTVFRPARQELQEAFKASLHEAGFLVQDIYLQVLPAYEREGPIKELSPEARRLFGDIAERPYRHQAAATRRILQDQPVILATGTGSGKTEAFLMPIVDGCLRRKGQKGVKALLLYPMNALINNQRDRLRRLLQGTGISFGRYTGETELEGPRPPDIPAEERYTRLEFWQDPPDILLTNYQMLDYMLLRDDGERIFRRHQVRFIVLDEVHTYHGKLGTDIAFLLRRLLAFLQKMNPEVPKPVFVGTSATLQSGTGEDPQEAIAAFFTRLTGQMTGPEAVILDAPLMPPPKPPGLTLPALPDIDDRDLIEWDPQDEDRVRRLAARLVGADGRQQSSRSASSFYAQTPLAYRLLEWLQRPLALGELVRRWAQERRGEPDERVKREVVAALLVGSALPDDDPLKLRLRVHRLLRGLLPFWRCLHPDCSRLLRHGERECPDCGAKALPLFLCRTCGRDFYAAYESPDEAGRLSPWVQSRSSDQTVFLYEFPSAEPAVDVEEEAGEEPEIEGIQETLGSILRLCPRCLAKVQGEACPSGCGEPLREFMVYRRRGTICPVCRSRYGRFDVLTPVSMGVSRALKEVARTLIQRLPEAQRKVLIFCDSRQDAAHQAWFTNQTEKRLWIRRAIYDRLKDETVPHDWEWLKDRVLEWLVEKGQIEGPRTRDARERARKRIDGGLLTEFAIQPNVRQSLERLGLVRVRYAGLEEVLQGEAFEDLCRAHGLRPDGLHRVIPHLLDLLRTRGALAHPVIQQVIGPGSAIAAEYDLYLGGGWWFPQALARPGQRVLPQSQQRQGGYRLLSPDTAMALWRRFLNQRATDELLQDVLERLEQGGYLVWTGIGSGGQGYQVVLDVVEFEVARNWVRCDTCGRVVANEPEDTPCPRVGYQQACQGTLRRWDGPWAEQNVWALQVAHPDLPPMAVGEHTAAVPDEDRQRLERDFQAVPPRVNAIACTPTLELGIDIGDLEAVALRNIPPHPAHYAQRAGRTGRQTRMGVVIGFSRARPHDGYYFDHPDEIIAGAIYPPRFYADNRIALACHARALVLEEARLQIPANLEPYISEEGQLNTAEVEALIRQVRDALDTGKRRALEVFCDLPWVNEEWLNEELSDFPEKIREALTLRARAIEKAVEQMRYYANKVRQTPQDSQLERGYRELANRLRTDRDYAYLPRVLAEAGLIPGYAFPPRPGSLHLGFDPQPIFTSRLQAQREYAPGQVVYARGRRWEVRGIALDRPGGLTERGIPQFEFTLCPSCGLANARDRNQCVRCHAELSEGTKVAWDAGAFRAETKTGEPEAEEERSFRSYAVEAHPQRDAEAIVYRLGEEAVLELRRQESIWWLNRGRQEFYPDGRLKEVHPFWLCSKCGEMVEPPANAPTRAQGQRARRRQWRHSQTCDGVPQEVALGHPMRADTLRVIVPGLKALGRSGVQWAWSLIGAVIHGAMRAFCLDEEDLEGYVFTQLTADGESVLEMFWVDPVVGGSGVLQDLAERFPYVARFALQHLEGHDCADSCYRCLRTYGNQRVHHLLNWRLIVPWLKAAAETTVEKTDTVPPPMEGPEWEAARREGCGSPAELRLLQALRAAGLPEPEKQYRVDDDRGRLVTVADLAYPDRCVLVYVDGLAFHSALPQRLHDYRVTRWLQQRGFRVLRFLATEVFRRTDACVREVAKALTLEGAEPG